MLVLVLVLVLSEVDGIIDVGGGRTLLLLILVFVLSGLDGIMVQDGCDYGACFWYGMFGGIGFICRSNGIMDLREKKLLIDRVDHE